MNLITHPWIPVLLRNGTAAVISPINLADANPAMRITWPRPDFRNIGMELLIGIFAVAFCPVGRRDWSSLLKASLKGSITTEDITAKLDIIKHAFELDNPNGPCFMQDFDKGLGIKAGVNTGDGNFLPPATLLINSPGKNTIDLNRDLFIKRPRDNHVMSRACAAIALYAYQSYADQGGAGHRVSYRGSLPATSLIIPKDATLLQIILANVPMQTKSITAEDYPKIFPWLANTYTSDGNNTLKPSQIHPLQALFSMPRRISLRFESNETARRSCIVSGEIDTHALTGILRRMHGVDYSPITELHPLSPYSKRGKINKNGSIEKDLSISPNPAGVGWYDVLGYVIPDEKIKPARCVQAYNELDGLADASVMIYGYARDGKTVGSFIEAQFPLISFSDPDVQDVFCTNMTALIKSAKIIAQSLRNCILSALTMSSISSVRVIMAQRQFWNEIRSRYLELFAAFHAHASTGAKLPDKWEQMWRQLLYSVAIEIYDLTVCPDPTCGKMYTKLDGWGFVAAKQRQTLEDTLNGYSKDGKQLFASLSIPITNI